jgi:hypothetical protein
LVADSGAIVTAPSSWQYLARGLITGVSPAEGQIGTSVTISGNQLFNDGDSVSAVFLSGVEAAFKSGNSTEIVVVAAHSDANVSGLVTIVSSSGAVVSGDVYFTYLFKGEVALVSPSRGQYGTVVHVRGSQLLGGGTSLGSITFSGVAPLSIDSVSDDLITVRIAKTSLLGVGDIEIVSNTDAIVTETNGWTYDVPSNITDICV